MKKFLVVLLSLGLIVAFGHDRIGRGRSSSAARTMCRAKYENNPTLPAMMRNYSRAFFLQRAEGPARLPESPKA